MSKPKLTPVQKRAITMLRNSGITVSLNTVAVPASVPGVTFTPITTPVVESKPRFVCLEPTCYKAAHAFSEVGAFGNATAKGHFDLNPSHGYKAV